MQSKKLKPNRVNTTIVAYRSVKHGPQTTFLRPDDFRDEYFSKTW